MEGTIPGQNFIFYSDRICSAKLLTKLKNLITALKILRYVEKLDGENEILVSGLALMLVDLT